MNIIILIALSFMVFYSGLLIGSHNDKGYYVLTLALVLIFIHNIYFNSKGEENE